MPHKFSLMVSRKFNFTSLRLKHKCGERACPINGISGSLPKKTLQSSQNKVKHPLEPVVCLSRMQRAPPDNKLTLYSMLYCSGPVFWQAFSSLSRSLSGFSVLKTDSAQTLSLSSFPFPTPPHFCP